MKPFHVLIMLFSFAAVCWALYQLSLWHLNRRAFASNVDVYVTERKRLISALLGDYKAADRLIAHEHELAKPDGCANIEAVRRALDRLAKDRSRFD